MTLKLSVESDVPLLSNRAAFSDSEWRSAASSSDKQPLSNNGVCSRRLLVCLLRGRSSLLQLRSMSDAIIEHGVARDSIHLAHFFWKTWNPVFSFFMSRLRETHSVVSRGGNLISNIPLLVSNNSRLFIVYCKPAFIRSFTANQPQPPFDKVEERSTFHLHKASIPLLERSTCSV